MKSKELQRLTASEPLTLQQEYDMQKSWHTDDDSNVHLMSSSYSFLTSFIRRKQKYSWFSELTFIVLCREAHDKTKNEVGKT